MNLACGPRVFFDEDRDDLVEPVQSRGWVWIGQELAQLVKGFVPLIRFLIEIRDAERNQKRMVSVLWCDSLMARLVTDRVHAMQASRFVEGASFGPTSQREHAYHLLA